MNLAEEITSFLDSKIKEGIAKSQVATKLLIQKPINRWISENTLITGSKAKSFYGFKLHESKHKGNFRDTDLVFKWNITKQSIEDFGDLCKFLEEMYGELEYSYQIDFSDWSHTTFKPEAMCKPALTHFAYNGEFYEIFEPINEEISYNGYVSLSTLVTCAKEWDRPKDKFFLDQIKALAQGL
jgi:hypothetical protein